MKQELKELIITMESRLAHYVYIGNDDKGAIVMAQLDRLYKLLDSEK